MGLTTGCAQCHSHKYDPITHTDYYRLMALMNNADEPTLDVPDTEIQRQRQKVDTEIRAFESEAVAKIDEEAFSNWLTKRRRKAVPWTPIVPVEATANLPRLAIEPGGTVFASGDFTKRDVYRLGYKLDTLGGKAITAIRLEVLPDPRLPAHGPGICYYEGRQGDFFLSEIELRAGGGKVAFAGGSTSFGKDQHRERKGGCCKSL